MYESLGECGSTALHFNPAHTRTMVIKRESIVSFLRTKRRAIDLLFARKFERFAECLSDDHWCSKLAYLADIFHELNLLNSGMQGRNENILRRRTCQYFK